jgi:uncharacterized protein YndB with AHSA1/START domain
MKKSLQFEAFYPHAPESVWEAITDPSAIRQWLLQGEFQARLGFRFRLSGKGMGRTSEVTGEVIQVIKEHKLAYTWNDSGDEGASGASVVSWTLTPKDGGTHVRLEHSLLDARGTIAIEAEQNWPVLLSVCLDGCLRRGAVPVPVVYVAEDPDSCPQPVLARAGFRQEEAK